MRYNSGETVQIPSRWLYTGLMLIVLFISLAGISYGFSYDRLVSERPLIVLTALLVAAGAVYMTLAWRGFVSTDSGSRLFYWVIIVGLAMRLAMFFSVPMMEDDWYRYLWDGAVTTAGLDPYERTPESVNLAIHPSTYEDSVYADLAQQGELILSRVNHPHLKTIYPPVAQTAFAAANLIFPWSLTGWRLVILLFDLATVLLALRLLANLGLPSTMIALWWWNPLIIKEFYNSAHMDIVIAPFLLGALLAIANRRLFSGSLLLGLAAGAKIWPVIILPIMLRGRWMSVRKAAIALGLFAIVCLILYLPLAGELSARASGFEAYFRRWEMNDALFMLPLWLFSHISGDPDWAQRATRITVGAVLALCVAWFCRKPWDNAGELLRRCLYVVAVMFMLSPTQFPWYFSWPMFLLALIPVRGLLLLTALLPLYYLRFYFDIHGSVYLFDNWIVWLQYLPVLAILAWDWLRIGRRTDMEQHAAG